MKAFVILLILISCQKKSDFKLTEAIVQEDMKCAVFERDLAQYIVVTKKGTEFVKNEVKALEAVSSFKIDLTSSRRSLGYFEKLYQDCTLIEGKRLTGCPYHTTFYNFFDELLEATKTYKWKAETKQKAIALVSSYARFQLKEPQNLNSVFHLAKTFERMSQHGLLKKDISAEIRKTISELDIRREKQLEGLRKTGIGNCDKALENFYLEVEIGTEFVKRMKVWEVALP